MSRTHDAASTADQDPGVPMAVSIPHATQAAARPNAARFAVGLGVAGILLILLGWYGAARLDYVEGQMPYLISGGLAGLALVAAALTLLVILEIRRHRLATTALLEDVLHELRALSKEGTRGAVSPEPAAGRARSRATARPATRRRSSPAP